jgi:hypothetical protein
MAFPVSEERIAAAEQELGARFPEDLRARLQADNHGYVAVGDWPEVWNLFPVWDDSDRSRIRRTGEHIVRENRAEWLEKARASGDFPADGLAFAADAGGNLLVATGGRCAMWIGATGELHDATVVWMFPGDELPPYVE